MKFVDIPKVIHYCWFGGNPLPESAHRCIDSWKKFLPDYEIREWNENNFDVNIIPYTSEAYDEGKYAFVSDYARFWILYNFGGVYFDTDVEVIRDMGCILDNGPFFGCEKNCNSQGYAEVNPGLGTAAGKGLEFYQKILEYYGNLHFRKPDGSLNILTIVYHTTEMLKKYGLTKITSPQEYAGITIYPKEFFCPKDYVSGRITITDSTFTIHHYSASWKSFIQKARTAFESVLGKKNAHFIGKIFRICHLYR